MDAKIADATGIIVKNYERMYGYTPEDFYINFKLNRIDVKGDLKDSWNTEN